MKWIAPQDRVRARRTRGPRLAGLFAAGAILIAAAGATALAGAVSGVVRDPTGEPVAAADVTLEGTAFRAQTVEDGRFVIDSVTEGTYVVVVERLGYRTARVEVRVPKDSAASVAVVLEPEGRNLGRLRTGERALSAWLEEEPVLWSAAPLLHRFDAAPLHPVPK
jgi:hypothetical protein